MILKKGHSTQYLLDVKAGKIPLGLGIQNPIVDEYIRFKRGQMNMILGFDNVGKTYWFQWYALALSSHHNIKWCLWMGEDEVGETMINLIQMYAGVRYDTLSEDEIKMYSHKIEYWFDFVDPSKVYTPQEILEIFKTSDADGYLIDPYTGLKRGFGFSDNYEFLNEVRQFCNEKKKTIYISLHPSTESGRNTGLHPKGHQFEGHIKPPKKADAEGGQSFANRADDFYIIHRYTSAEGFENCTYLHVKKNKRNRTGGKPTTIENPIIFDFNYGLGFRIAGVEGIKRNRKKEPTPENIQNFLKQNKGFYDTVEPDQQDIFKQIDGDIPF